MSAGISRIEIGIAGSLPQLATVCIRSVGRTAAGPGPLVVAVAVPIRDKHGNPVGILAATYSLEALADKFKAVQKGTSADFYILDQHSVVAASPASEPHSDPVFMSIPGVTDRVLAGIEGRTRVHINGEDAFVGFAPIPRLGWAAIHDRSANDALAPAMLLHDQFRSMTIYLQLI